MAVDTESLRSLCSAVAASNFDISNRVKAIAQLAHERLGTSSVIVYEYNLITRELDLVAMPGVPDRELMRGPTDKLIFEWETAKSEHGQAGVWLTDSKAFDKYLDGLASQVGWPSDASRTGTFRDRELAHQRTLHNCAGGDIATAKIYLWKGIGQTEDRVGQVFYNLFVGKPSGGSPFTPELVGCIRYVSDLIRELLIEKGYHFERRSAELQPEELLYSLDRVFDKYERDRRRAVEGSPVRRPGGTAGNVGLSADHEPDALPEAEIARIIRGAAQRVTQTYIGHSEFIYVIGQRLLRVFGDDVRSPYELARIVADSDIESQVINDGRYYIRNVTSTGSAYSDSETERQLSTMIVPVVLNGEVRALVKLTTPVPDRLLDAQAKAMQTVERFARYSLIRLADVVQSTRMSHLLGFYADRLQMPGSEDTDVLLQGVLRAFGAEQGTVWWIDSCSPTGEVTIRRGTEFSALETRDVLPDDSRVGIRMGDEMGLTQALIRLNRPAEGLSASDANNGNVFLACHLFPYQPDTSNPTRRYYLETFSESKPPGELKECRRLFDGFWRCAVTDTESLPGLPVIVPKEECPELHTRLAFLVREGDTPRAVVWLKFPSLHEVAWLERRYVAGFSNSLGELLRAPNLKLVLRNFRHGVRGSAEDANAAVTDLARCVVLQNDELGNAVRYLRAFIASIESKASVTDLLLADPRRDGGKPDPDGTFADEAIGDLVDRVVVMGGGLTAARRGSWRVVIGDAVAKTDPVSGVFYPVLLNLVNNATRHGLPHVKEGEQPRIAIWIRKTGCSYVACVANNGAEVDPVWLEASISKDLRKTGIRVSRAILRAFRGKLSYFKKQEFFEAYPDAPEDLRVCDTFAEFELPIIRKEA